MRHMDRSLVRQSGFLEAEDGVWLFWQGIEPRADRRGSVALLHGYNSSSNYLLPLMRTLAEDGFACYSLDYRGHGRSEGVKRHVFHFEEYLSDARTLCRHVSRRAGDGEVFLFGNSLGGLIVSHYGLIHPDQLRGTVLTAPFFGPAFRVPRCLDWLARVTSRFHPTFRLPRQRREQPELVTLRWWTETLTAQEHLQREAEHFRVPLLLLHGEADTVACPNKARALFERLGSRDKTFRTLPGATHRDLDPCYGSTWWGDVRAWLARRSAPSLRQARVFG